MADTSHAERAIALKAFTALYPEHARMTDMPRLMQEIEELGRDGFDRFGILTRLLEKRGLSDETRKTWSFMRTLQRRHAEARARVDKLAPRTDENAIRFDDAKSAELALHNAICAAFEDANTDLVSMLAQAGLNHDAGEALLSLKINQQLRYESDHENAQGYADLIDFGLALNISTHFPGGSKGIMLSAAGDILWRVIMGQRIIPKRASDK